MFASEPDVKFSHLLINYIITFISTVTYAVICLLFYSSYENAQCTKSGIKIQNWVIVCGIVYCFIPLIHFSVFGIKKKIFAFLYFFYSFILYLPFNIIWSVLGSVMLFENSYNCLIYAKNIWILSLTILIFQWITIFSILWELYDKCKSIDLS